MSQPDPTAAPIPYALPGLSRRAPIDWPATIRQVIFSVGLGLVAVGVALYLSRDGRTDTSPPPIGFGVTLASLAVPWPGRVGRRRDPAAGREMA